MSRVLESSGITCQDMETDDCPEDSCWTAQSQIIVMAAEEQEVFLQLLMMKPGSLKGNGLNKFFSPGSQFNIFSFDECHGLV